MLNVHVTGSHFTRIDMTLTSCLWLFLLQAIAAASNSKLHMYTSVDTNFVIDSIEMNKQELVSLKQNLSQSDIDERRLAERTRSWLTSTIEHSKVEKGSLDWTCQNAVWSMIAINFCICRFRHVVASTLSCWPYEENCRELERAKFSASRQELLEPKSVGVLIPIRSQHFFSLDSLWGYND